MDVNVMACVFPEYRNSSRFVSDVPAPNPQKQAALLELLLEIQGMMNANPRRQNRAYGAARTAGNRCRRDCCGKCAARDDYRSGRDNCTHVDQSSNQTSLRVADGFGRYVRRSRDGQVVRH